MAREREQNTRQLSVRQPFLQVHRFRVEVISGPDKGKSVEWQDSDFHIGTAASNELVLVDGSVSRHHCTISSHPKYFRVVDLDSTNGTYVGELRIDSSRLPDRSIVRLGVTKLRFTVLADTVRHDLASENEFGDLRGESATMRKLFGVLPRVAASDATVLVLGETGTGKSMLAEAIHHASKRAEGAFIDVDCGAIAPSLLESELFGHEKGAFTGAHSAKPGVLELAKGGTVLLDEIGELPLEMQPKLLRAIEQRRIRRIGGTTPIEMDCRIVATTNRNLRQEVNRGAFRSDLFYRLNIVTLTMPPLRERREDIRLIARSFVADLVPKEEVLLYEVLIEEWAKRDWPGNVRELKNAITRSVVMGTPASQRPPSSFPPARLGQGGDAASAPVVDSSGKMLPFRSAKQNAIGEWEREYISELLRQCEGNLSKAARLARTDRAYLRGLARKYDLLPT